VTSSNSGDHAGDHEFPADRDHPGDRQGTLPPTSGDQHGDQRGPVHGRMGVGPPSIGGDHPPTRSCPTCNARPGLARKIDASNGGPTGTQPARWYAIDDRRGDT
jgi:hypothetical protein